MNINSTILKDQFSDLIKAIKFIFPQNSSERWILSLFFIFYVSYGVYLNLNSSILDWEYMWVDRFYLFDNPTLFHTGKLNIASHPIIFLFAKPLLILSDILVSAFENNKAKTIFISSFCAYLIASSIMYIHRYMINVAEIKKHSAHLLTIFYGFFFTNLILSFTIESYPYSLFLLSFSVTYYSCVIKSNDSPKFITNLLICISLGGITITNFVKGVLPMYFTKEGIIKALYKTFVIGLVFIVILSFVEIKFHIFEGMFNHYNEYSINEKSSILLTFPLYRYIIDLFLGAPILFSGNTIIRGTEEHLINHLLILPKFYQYIWQYVYIGVLYLFVVISFIKNRKNKYMIMLFFLFLIDIIIHVVLKYGVENYFIFGGHWVYLIPLILSWLYKTNKYGKSLNITFGILTSVLIINNIFYLIDFIQLSINIFPLE